MSKSLNIKTLTCEKILRKFSRYVCTFRQPYPMMKANFMEIEYNFSKYLGMMVNQNVQSEQNLPLILISHGLALKKKNS